MENKAALATELRDVARERTTDDQMDEKEEWLLTGKIDGVERRLQIIEQVKEMYRKAKASFWIAEEVDLGSDMKDWGSLSDGEKHFIKMVLAFFAASDGIVLENLALRFLVEVKIPEVRAFYAFQVAMETVHSETYSLLIEQYIRDEQEKAMLNRAIQTIPAVQRKADWAVKWMESKTSTFAHRVLAFCCVEGILFSGSFCAIFYLKKRGLLPGLTFSNELISRDEGMHTDFGVLMFEALDFKPATRDVQGMIQEAVDVEKQFTCDSLPCDLIGMNAQLMEQYIRFVADRLLTQLGYPKVYQVANPFPWMEMMSVPGKTNFFEKRVGEYQKAGVMMESGKEKFALEEDF